MKKLIWVLISLIIMLGLLAASFWPPGEGGPATTTGAGVLNLYGIDPFTLDPALVGDASSSTYVIQLFSGLLRLGDDLEPVGDIARSWQVSDDGRIYTFRLRDDVYFHDGGKVKAQDFKYSWERAASPATGSQVAATYLGDIVGVNEMLAGESEHISGVEVLGDYSLRVTIDEPKSYFLSKLTYVTSFVVDRANVEQGGEWWRNPSGTGPCVLKQWLESSRLELERNANYYGELAKVDSVVFHLWAGVPMNLYETGEIDVASVNVAYIDRVSDEAGVFYQDLTEVSELNLMYIGFNFNKPPFDDANIRRAFSQALDKAKLVSLVFRDTVMPAEGILPPGMPGFNPALSGLGYDIDRAKELIAASEYGDVSNLPPITITTGGWGGLIPGDLEAIIHQWRINLGVEVAVRQLEPEEFLYNIMQEKDEMFFWGWNADYPHPQNFLEILFGTGSESNAGEYSNLEVDALLQMAGVEPNSQLSLELYQQAEQELVSDAACLPLWFGQNFTLVKPYVTGYDINPLGFVMLNRVSVLPH
jgi:oligopeptide transport system substrate-binding protein